MRVGLNELEAIVAVARCKGFRSAARHLGVSASALSHAVAGVEDRLAVRLFNRTTRSVSLTPAGERLVDEVEPALRSIGSAISEAGTEAREPAGTLRLNVSPGAARMMLQPIIVEYVRRHPQVTVEVATESALIDVTRAGFDAGVRLADAIPPDMIAVPIFRQLRMVVVGAPAYLRGRTIPSMPADLMRHLCIRMRLASGRVHRWEFERWGEAAVVEVRGNLVLDSNDLVLSAAIDGAGLAYVEEGGASAHVASGCLIRMLDDWTPTLPELSLYYARARHLPATMRALVDLVRERARRTNP